MTEPGQKDEVPGGEASVRVVVKLAEDEIAELDLKQIAIAKRKQELKKILSGLGSMFGSHVLSENSLRLLNCRPPSGKRGLTNACRRVMVESDGPLRASEICKRLNQLIPSLLENHKSPTATVSTIMNRLVGYGEARSVIMSDGLRGWESTGNAAQDQSGSIAIGISEPASGR